MGKSGLSGQEFPEKRKEKLMKLGDKTFFVKTISKNVTLSEFDRDFVVDLDAAIRLSEKKGKISVQDLPLIQLSN
jgi:hypothetical protein